MKGLAAIDLDRLRERLGRGTDQGQAGNTEARCSVRRPATNGSPTGSSAIPAGEKPSSARRFPRPRRGRPPARRAGHGHRKGALEIDCRSRRSFRGPPIEQVRAVHRPGATRPAVRQVGPRTSMFQAVLPIRGRVLINVEKSPDRPGATQHRCSPDHRVERGHLATGPGRLRYHKIVLMADDIDWPAHPHPAADPLFRFCGRWSSRPRLPGRRPVQDQVEQGAHEFAYSDRERDGLIAEGELSRAPDDQGRGCQAVQGLGEDERQEGCETTWTRQPVCCSR